MRRGGELEVNVGVNEQCQYPAKSSRGKSISGTITGQPIYVCG